MDTIKPYRLGEYVAARVELAEGIGRIAKDRTDIRIALGAVDNLLDHVRELADIVEALRSRLPEEEQEQAFHESSKTVEARHDAAAEEYERETLGKNRRGHRG